MAGNIVREVDDWIRPRHVLVSVFDKRDLQVLVNGLVSINDSLRIFSTGGTYKRIAEILGPEQTKKHKTLDFTIYLGLLTETYNDDHQEDLRRTSAVPIDMVVVNLYPFQQTVARPDVTVEEARANIDIGGPCMVRASAKNFPRVASVTDPGDYAMIVNKLRTSGGRLDLRTRFALARKAFAHTAEYDAHISRFLAERTDAEMEGCYEKRGD